MWRDRFQIKECKVVLNVLPRQLVAELCQRNVSVRRLRAEFGEYGFFTILNSLLSPPVDIISCIFKEAGQ